MSIAPWVSSGHSENAMLAAVDHLLHRHADEPREAAAAVLGGNGTAPPGFDVLAVGLGEAVGRGDLPSALRRLRWRSPTRLSGANSSAAKRPASARMPSTVSGSACSNPARRARPSEVHDLLEHEPDVGEGRRVVAHRGEVTRGVGDPMSRERRGWNVTTRYLLGSLNSTNGGCLPGESRPLFGSGQPPVDPSENKGKP